MAATKQKFFCLYKFWSSNNPMGYTKEIILDIFFLYLSYCSRTTFLMSSSCFRKPIYIWHLFQIIRHYILIHVKIINNKEVADELDAVTPEVRWYVHIGRCDTYCKSINDQWTFNAMYQLIKLYFQKALEMMIMDVRKVNITLVESLDYYVVFICASVYSVGNIVVNMFAHPTPCYP